MPRSFPSHLAPPRARTGLWKNVVGVGYGAVVE
jgi:hypothetical protein